MCKTFNFPEIWRSYLVMIVPSPVLVMHSSPSPPAMSAHLRSKSQRNNHRSCIRLTSGRAGHASGRGSEVHHRTPVAKVHIAASEVKTRTKQSSEFMLDPLLDCKSVVAFHAMTID